MDRPVPDELLIGEEDPAAPEVLELRRRHLAFSRSVTPPEGVFALDDARPPGPDISFFGARRDGALVGIGALRRLDDRHGEVKSMHTAEEARGAGVARALLDHLIDVATERGYERLSLETGTMAAFAPAHALYLRAGFRDCPPFGPYVDSATSRCMTLDVRAGVGSGVPRRDESPPLRVHVLGPLRVDGVDQRELGGRKGRRLLGALAVAGGHAVPADSLIDVLWPEGPPRRPVDQIGVLVSRLRRVVGTDRIERTDAGYLLHGDWCDLEELAGRAADAAAALDAGRLTAARAAAEAALSLGEPDVLPAEDGPWIEVPRARARAHLAAARRVAVEAAVASGDLAAATTHAEALLSVNPLDEPVTRALMLAQVQGGRPGAALATYARLRSRLAEELGVSPSAEIESLHTAIVTGDESVTAAAGPARSDAFTGRTAELASLDHHRSGLGDGAAVVVIEGEPGIGKTALIDAWTGGLDSSTTVVLRGRCDPLGRDLPLQPVADALHDAVRADPQVLDALVADDRVLLAQRLGIGPADDDADTSIVDGPARLNIAIDHLLDALTAGGAAVVVLDDLHHAELSTLAWIGHAYRRGRRLLIVTARHPGTAPLDDATVIRLGELDRAAVAELVGEEDADELLARSGGHPLLLRALTDVGAGPTTLHDALRRQLGALGDAAPTICRAAVLGPEVDLDLLAAVEALPAASLLTRLEAAAAAGLLTDSTTGLRFRHELVREGLEAEVSAARRSLLHREAARQLAQRSTPDWGAVAFHARLGDEPHLAAVALGQAAAAAQRRFDLVAATAYLDEAIALAPSAEAFTDRARVRMSRQDLDGAAADAAEAIAHSGGAPSLGIAAWIAYYRRRYEEARAFADQAVATATDESVRIGGLAVGGRVRHGAGDLAGARRLLEQVGTGTPEVRGVADVWHAHVLVHAGDAAGALRLADRALSAGDGLAQPFAPLHGRFARIMALGHLGRTRDALVACEDLDATIVRFGEQAVRFRAPAANVRGWLLRSLGHHDTGEDAHLAALDAAGLDGRPRSESTAEGFWVAMLDLTDSALTRGELDLAAERLARCAPVDHWAGTMAWHQRHRLELLRARLARASGDTTAAAERAAAVLADADRRGARRYAAIAGVVVASADDHIDPAAAVGELERVAGSEAWRFTAELARIRHDDGLRRLAERRFVAFRSAAGDDGPWLDRFAATVLGR